jgi:hypothetical protein
VALEPVEPVVGIFGALVVLADLLVALLPQRLKLIE